MRSRKKMILATVAAILVVAAAFLASAIFSETQAEISCELQCQLMAAKYNWPAEQLNLCLEACSAGGNPCPPECIDHPD